MSFEEPKARVPGSQPVALEGAIDGAGSDLDAAQSKLVGDPLRPPGRLGEGLRQDAPLDLGVERGWPSRPPAAALGVEPIGAVLQIPTSELVEERAANACLSAGGTDVVEFFGPAEQSKSKGVYLVFEGHCGPSQVDAW